MSDNVVPANVDTCLVEFNKKEYAIVGDALFANTVEEVPQWFQNLIQDKVLQVNGPMQDMLTQYNLSLLAALQGLDIAKNTYEQYIYKVATDSEAYVASLTTLNSTIADNDASIRQLLTTYTNELGLAISTAASTLNSRVDDSNATIYNIQTTYATQDYVAATASQLLSASLNGGAIGARISSTETAMATQYGAMAQRLQTLESSFDDVSGQQGANASAIQALTAYTGYGVYNGADALIANSNFYSNLNAYLDGTDYSIGGSSTLIQDVTAVSTEKMKQVEAKFEYGSTIEIDGKPYNAGFGLVQTGTLLPDGVTYDSEFWVRASRFKFIADDGVTTSTPFQISGNTVYIGWDAITGSTKPEDGATRNVNRGTWASGVVYVVGDIVQYNGSSYTNKIATSSIVPTNTSYWTLLASQGISGINNAVVSIYYKNTSSSVAPTASITGPFTYTFSTNVLSGGVLNGWTTTLPTAGNGEYVWVRQATASSSTNTDTIDAAEFSGAVCLSGVGVNGLNTATVYLYAVNTSNTTPPSAFSGTFTYTFATGVLSGGVLNEWTQSVPTVPKSSYLWVRQATATSNGTTDSINSSEFSSAVVISGVGKDGDAGAPGATGKRGATTIGYSTSVGISSYSSYDSDFNTQIGSTGVRIKGDTIIVTSSSSTDGGTKTWVRSSDGSTSWTSYALIINGNVLVDGSISANKITSGTMSVGSNGGYASKISYTNGSSSHLILVEGYSAYASMRVCQYNSSSAAAKFEGIYNGADPGIVRLAVNGKAIVADNGVISAPDGVTPFTGVHDCAVQPDSIINVGDIVIDTGVGYTIDISNSIMIVGVSSQERDKRAVGVFQKITGVPFLLQTENLDDDSETDTLDVEAYPLFADCSFAMMNSVGEGAINVCGLGGDISVGDLITTSSISGKGMKQSDDLVRNYTVAKCRENVTFDYPEQVKQVACIYMCG